MNTKICPKCNQELPFSSYPKDKSRKDGIYPYCKECNYKHSRKWVLDHKEQAAAYLHDYRQVNIEKARAYGRQHSPKYRKEKPEVHRNVTRTRRARKRANTPEPLTRTVIEQRMVDCGARCVYCGGEYSHVDHVIAVARGGGDVIHNLVPSCGDCNVRKGSTDWIKWFRKQPFYSFERELWIAKLISSPSATCVIQPTGS